jgi:hypothetical protein
MAALADEVGQSEDLGAAARTVQTGPAGRLSQSFNAMMDRLQEAYARVATALAAQQRFTADASHELRTPADDDPQQRRVPDAAPRRPTIGSDAALSDIAARPYG